MSAIASSLSSRDVKLWCNNLMNRMIKAKPEIYDYVVNKNIPKDPKIIEEVVTFSGLVSIKNMLESDYKDFVMESEIANDFYKGKHIPQDYTLTLKLPFPLLYINFTDPIDIEMIKNPIEEEQSYEDWLKYYKEDKSILVINKLIGMIFQKDPELFKERQVNTIDFMEKSKVKTMSDDFYNYYVNADKDRMIKIYFVIKEGNGDYSFSDVFLDTDKLPEFVSEFAVGVCNLNEKENKYKVQKIVAKLLNMAIQVINFINSKDYVEARPTWKSMKSKEKYEAKMGKQLPPDFYMLRVKYPQNIYTVKGETEKRSPYGYQFDVRGHFRHLKSEKYKYKRGQVIWIPNYKKGKGIYIPKRYAIDSEKNIEKKYGWNKIEEVKEQVQK